MSGSKNRTLYFDLLRIIAAFAVVLIHCCATSISARTIDAYWHALNVYDSISRFAVPVFFMISGALFLDKNRTISTKSLYTKNILRLFTVYVFWSVFYACFTVFLNSSFSLGSFLKNTVSGYYHMWFIPAMIGMYILLPLIKKVTESDNLTRYFLIISLVLFIVPKFIVLVLRYTGNTALVFLGDSISSVISDLKLNPLNSYAFYFVLGHFLHSTELSKKFRIASCLLGIAGFVGVIAITAILSVKNGRLNERVYSYSNVLVFLQAQGVFVLAKKLPTHKINSRAQSLIGKLSKYTFGCYLIHPLLIKLYETYIISDAVYPPKAFITVPLLAITVFIVSTALSAVLKHIPIIKKYIV